MGIIQGFIMENHMENGMGMKCDFREIISAKWRTKWQRTWTMKWTQGFIGTM